MSFPGTCDAEESEFRRSGTEKATQDLSSIRVSEFFCQT